MGDVSNDTILVTGGAGFIGCNFIHRWLKSKASAVVNLDLLTYAGSLSSLRALHDEPRHVFVRGDIRDEALVAELLATHRPAAIVHFAAQTHVDRSLVRPGDFLETNVGGTCALLRATQSYWQALDASAAARFRFLHVSTDEVFGSLAPGAAPFDETTPYDPRSPYAASKAAADHFVRAWHHSFGLPTLITNCSNNYGPYQHPEKLLPLMIYNALQGLPLPIYGDGLQVRDWLHVSDHCRAVMAVLERGTVGATYCIGGDNQRTNLAIVKDLCGLLDDRRPLPGRRRYGDLIAFVTDRAGHDRRYAIDAAKLKTGLGWAPAESLDTGLAKTVDWYLDNLQWVEDAARGISRDM